ncbi:DUF924 family protein [Halovulum marinum]|uniref:DUF924 family protein n=1 Tax=Halovulum marinum TaxID=2662447 RepID=UPI001F3C0C3D|nr:DUF924 family protein [Halovulum marinum]
MGGDYDPETVLEFWFPDDGHWTDRAAHGAFWDSRMQGGMDAAIIARFADLTLAAATGRLEHWADTARGRLALLIALDQFPRSLWRDTPAAFAQDIRAARLALQGIENGHYVALASWEQAFHIIALGHCEGPDHLARLDLARGIATGIAARLQPPLEDMGAGFLRQTDRVRGIIARFGRHPHRNPVLGRPSSPEEAAYIATGDFSLVRKVAQMVAPPEPPPEPPPDLPADPPPEPPPAPA